MISGSEGSAGCWFQGLMAAHSLGMLSDEGLAERVRFERQLGLLPELSQATVLACLDTKYLHWWPDAAHCHHV